MKVVVVEIAARRAAQYWEPMRSLNVIARQALSRHDSPFGVVGLMHEGTDLKAWWIWKDREEIEPTLAVMDRDDLIFIVRGSLRIELDGRDPIDLRAGDLFVIPAGTPFRGYRWPRESEPCQFVAVAPADATFNRVEGRTSESVRR